MTYTEERDRFIHQAAAAGLSVDQSRALLRHATTLQRLAVAACNGDWPCDNGERKTEACPLCESGFVPSVITGGPLARAAWMDKAKNGGALATAAKACPDCRTAAAVQVLLSETKLIPKFGGDPRGAVLKLYPANTPADDIKTGRARDLYVPARCR